MLPARLKKKNEKEQKGIIVDQAEMCLRVNGIVSILSVLSLSLSGVKST